MNRTVENRSAHAAGRLPPGVSLRTRLPRQWWVGYLFVAPAVALFLLVGAYTVYQSLRLCFSSWDGFSPTMTWVGLDNFHQFLGGNPVATDEFTQAMEHNIILCLAVPTCSCLLGLGLALLLNRSGALTYLLRTAFFLPVVCGGVATLYTWQLLYQPGGAIAALLSAVHLDALVPYNGFLGDTSTALAAVTVVYIWGAAPMAMLLYLAGLQTVSPEILESAEIDGANAWQRLWLITWPLLYPITALLVIMFLNTVIQDYQTVFLMTNGNPANATNVVGLMVYNYAQSLANSTANTTAVGGMGTGAAMGWLLAAATLVVAMTNLRIFRARD
jgi:multiple sugar transport system permease protein